MTCPEVQQRLSRLIDGERSGPALAAAPLAAHLFRCARCRAAARSFQRLRRLCRDLPAPAPSAGLRARVLASIAQLDLPTGPLPPRRVARKRALGAAGAAGGLALVAVLAWYVLAPRAMAGEVAAALDRANTWHLSGWKEGHAGRVWCEVWGRRHPFFYYEQTGDEVLHDNGRQRVRLIPAGSGQRIALVTGSQPSSGANRWMGLVAAGSWSRRRQPWRVERDTVIFRTSDSGMQGPFSVAHDYYFIDRRTWLPRRWEYRHVKRERERVVDSLTAEYNRPIPPDVEAPPSTVGTRVIDAAAPPPIDPRQEHIRCADGLTVQLLPVALGEDGMVLASLRGWVGATPVEGRERLELSAGGLIRSPVINGRRHPWAIVDDRGRPYICCGIEAPMIPRFLEQPAERLLRFAPLEPLAAGEALPRQLRLYLHASASAWVQEGRALRGVPVLRHDFDFELPLPERPGPRPCPEIWDEYVASLPKERIGGILEVVPPEIYLAHQRAWAYRAQSDTANSIRWLQWGIDQSKPDSDFAQSLRILLAGTYRIELKDEQRWEALLREVLARKRRYPQMSDFYVVSAIRQLKVRGKTVEDEARFRGSPMYRMLGPREGNEGRAEVGSPRPAKRGD